MTNYAIFAADADIYYYEGAPEELFCPSCDSYIGSKPYLPSNLKVQKLEKDFSYSYDGKLILSNKAKAFLEENISTELVFHKVNSEPEAFVFETPNIAIFDAEKRKTRFIDKCDQCGNFESIIGSTPPFLKIDHDLDKMGVYFTDIQFGSGREKSPLIIVGEQLGLMLKKAFKEIDLEEVRN